MCKLQVGWEGSDGVEHGLCGVNMCWWWGVDRVCVSGGVELGGAWGMDGVYLGDESGGVTCEGEGPGGVLGG